MRGLASSRPPTSIITEQRRTPRHSSQGINPIFSSSSTTYSSLHHLPKPQTLRLSASETAYPEITISEFVHKRNDCSKSRSNRAARNGVLTRDLDELLLLELGFGHIMVDILEAEPSVCVQGLKIFPYIGFTPTGLNSFNISFGFSVYLMVTTAT